MTKVMNTGVLIIGAGPTGLMAANQCMRFGVDFIIVDQKSSPTKESRALVVTARSLEIYQQMGLAKHAVQNGKIVEAFNLYAQGKRRAAVKIGEIGKGLSEFSYALTFEQFKNEELLTQNLLQNGKIVHWNYEFLKLKEHKSGITALVKHGDEVLTIQAQYLIACDGARSPVRQQLNFSFKGGTYKHKFFVADTILKWDLMDNQLIISPGSKNFCAFLPLKEKNSYRIIGSLPRKYFENEDITFQDIAEIVKHTIGVNVTFDKVNWFSIYKLHHRSVDHFNEGRVFLAGDSAHIHSPAGGQGMNTGLQDAYNLCWKLALVLKKQAKPALLNTYNEERLPFAKWLLRFTDRGFIAMTSDNWFIRFFRQNIAVKVAGLALINDFMRTFAFKVISQIGYSHKSRTLSKFNTSQKLSFKAGDRLPYFPEGNIYPDFTDASFHMLHIASQPLGSEKWEKLKSIFPFPVKLVENELSDKWKKLGVKQESFILVRPDNYMAFVFDEPNVQMIKDYLEKYFGFC